MALTEMTNSALISFSPENSRFSKPLKAGEGSCGHWRWCQGTGGGGTMDNGQVVGEAMVLLMVTDGGWRGLCLVLPVHSRVSR